MDKLILNLRVFDFYFSKNIEILAVYILIFTLFDLKCAMNVPFIWPLWAGFPKGFGHKFITFGYFEESLAVIESKFALRIIIRSDFMVLFFVTIINDYVC